jgi:hypothetical protein
MMWTCNYICWREKLILLICHAVDHIKYCCSTFVDNKYPFIYFLFYFLQSTYIYRVQSTVWRLPKYWPPTPSPPSECVLPRVSTEVRFWLPSEYGIFWKTYGIPRNFAEFRGIFFSKIARNSAEFRGIPYVFAYGIPHVTNVGRYTLHTYGM